MNDNIETEVGGGSGLVPPKPPRTLGEDYSTQASRGAGEMQQQHKAAEATGKALYALPNGELGYLDEDEEWIGSHQYLAARHSSLFADAVNLLDDPQPGCKYVWAAKYAPKGDKANAQTVANIRSGRYRPVETSELKEGLEVPVEEHKIAGHTCAGIVDVVLMEVSPEAQRTLYKWRTFEAKQRTNRYAAFGELQSKVEAASGGQAHAEIEIKD